jgi:signal peptidase II
MTKGLAVARWANDRRIDSGPLRLHVIRNPGGPFGIAPDWSVAFALVALLAMPVLVRAAAHEATRLERAAIGLVVGGAAGNLADRLFRAPGPMRGAVVDWLRIDPYRPVFNIADVALRLGAALIVVTMITRADHSTRANARPNVS